MFQIEDDKIIFLCKTIQYSHYLRVKGIIAESLDLC